MMHETFTPISKRSRRTAALAAVVLLITGAAGAANRVVLGEYFTNLY
jgi:hypothetical protein